MIHVLLVDDEPVLREVLGTLLRRNGFSVIEADSVRNALAAVALGDIALVLLDLMLPDGHGLDVLRKVKETMPEVPVVVITAYSSIDGAIEAMREGAFHYIPKPFKNDEVLLTVRRALESRDLRVENRALRAEADRRHGFESLVGRSEPMRKVFELVRLAAPSKANILIEGESGTGKELVARAIHRYSPRNAAAFLAVNSGSTPPDLLESTLFGHVRGAFTGAVANKPGLFEAAASGTIFLDEIGTIPLETQAKLLRVIQEKEFLPLGATATRKADVRIVAATNVDLGRLVSEGKFREDLYYRLHVITIALPPLRQRREDIPLLVRHFVDRFAAENGRGAFEVPAETMRRLVEASWPGNVRELENAIERAVVLAPNGHLGPDLFPEAAPRSRPTPMPFAAAGLPPGMSLKEAVEEYERDMILRALTLAGGVQKKAAEILRVKPTTLNEMIKRLGLGSRRETASVESDL